jgi:hypothetical protein
MLVRVTNIDRIDFQDDPMIELAPERGLELRVREGLAGDFAETSIDDAAIACHDFLLHVPA